MEEEITPRRLDSPDGGRRAALPENQKPEAPLGGHGDLGTGETPVRSSQTGEHPVWVLVPALQVCPSAVETGTTTPPSGQKREQRQSPSSCRKSLYGPKHLEKHSTRQQPGSSVTKEDTRTPPRFDREEPQEDKETPWRNPTRQQPTLEANLQAAGA